MIESANHPSVNSETKFNFNIYRLRIFDCCVTHPDHVRRKIAFFVLFNFLSSKQVSIIRLLQHAVQLEAGEKESILTVPQILWILDASTHALTPA